MGIESSVVCHPDGDGKGQREIIVRGGTRGTRHRSGPKGVSSKLSRSSNQADIGDSPLYTTFVTPWADPTQVSQQAISEPFQIPPCYEVHPPPVETKFPDFTDETMFYIFYMYPRDLYQLEAAEEL